MDVSTLQEIQGCSQWAEVSLLDLVSHFVWKEMWSQISVTTLRLSDSLHVAPQVPLLPPTSLSSAEDQGIHWSHHLMHYSEPISLVEMGLPLKNIAEVPAWRGYPVRMTPLSML